MADTSTYRVCTGSFSHSSGATVYQGEVRPAADALVTTANPGAWAVLDTVIAAARWLAVPVKDK
jgi:hypothetical protein